MEVAAQDGREKRANRGGLRRPAGASLLPSDAQEPSSAILTLTCQSCSRILSDRGMKVQMVFDPDTILYSTDCSPSDTQYLDEVWKMPGSCGCEVQDFRCCCGLRVGYWLASPCSSCLAAQEESDHRWFFCELCVHAEPRHGLEGRQLTWPPHGLLGGKLLGKQEASALRDLNGRSCGENRRLNTNVLDKIAPKSCLKQSIDENIVPEPESKGKPSSEKLSEPCSATPKQKEVSRHSMGCQTSPDKAMSYDEMSATAAAAAAAASHAIVVGGAAAARAAANLAKPAFGVLQGAGVAAFRAVYQLPRPLISQGPQVRAVDPYSKTVPNPVFTPLRSDGSAVPPRRKTVSYASPAGWHPSGSLSYSSSPSYASGFSPMQAMTVPATEGYLQWLRRLSGCGSKRLSMPNEAYAVPAWQAYR